MMTDPLADMLTRIRNAVRIEWPVVDMPASRLKANVAEVLKSEGYIYDYQLGSLVAGAQGHADFKAHEGQGEAPKKAVLRVFLKYGPQGEKVLQHLERISTPGCRVYRSYKELRPVLDGLGITVLSTSQGVMSDRQAKAKKLGGELLCTIW
jgi:small subunit ribosomal protein S8